MSSRAARWLRFLLAGITNTILSYTVYLLLNGIMPYQAAYSGAYFLGIVSGYYLNATYVFRYPLSWKGLLAYPSVYIIQYLASALLLGGLVEFAGINETLAPLLVVSITLPLTYLASKSVLHLTGSRRT